VEQPLINSIGIALANNEYDKLFERGHGLPLKATRDYRTVLPLKHGHAEDIFRVPVVEGENEKADRNRLNGALVIRGDMIRRDLPAGSDVEVTLKMDESRILTVAAYVPVLDEEFPGRIEMIRHQPDPEELIKDFEAEMARIREVRSKATAVGGETAGRIVDAVEASPLAQEVKENLAAGNADPGAALKGEKQLLELKLKLDQAADALEWPALVSESRGCLQDLRVVVNEHGSDQQKLKAKDLAEQIEQVIRDHKADRLRKKIEQIVAMYYEIVMAQSGWWVFQFQRMEEQERKMSDQAQGRKLLGQGRDCMAKNNVPGLKNVVRQLWNLLSEETVQQAKRGYGATILRR
jgi:molecular chaperone DnaK